MLLQASNIPPLHRVSSTPLPEAKELPAEPPVYQYKEIIII
jgi:hypothetical protein